MLRSGIRRRLMAWVAAVLAVSAALTFAVVYRESGRELRAQIDRDLRTSVGQLSGSLSLPAGRSPGQIAAAARRYCAAQPYRATSTLLIALVPGAGPVSNHPELFGSVRADPGETVSEQGRENAQARTLMAPRAGYFRLRLPDVGDVRLLERTLAVGGVQVTVGAGAPLAAVESSQHSVARAFVLAGALALGLAVVASFFAGSRVSAPLRRMAQVAARVDAGDLAPRMHLGRSGRRDEVRVLAESFNHMLDRLADAFARQREFVADASHELRTPLTIIRGQLEVLAAQAAPSADEVRRVERLLQAEIARVTRLVDDMLLLAQSEQPAFVHPEPIALASFVRELWAAITPTAERRFELGPVPSGVLSADPDRLAQALHNLVSNAVAHTAAPNGLVQLSVAESARGRLVFAVEDDGPGVPPVDRERIFERFQRTDSSRARSTGGAGLGLAIVRAIAAAHGGSARAGDAAAGGARFELELPGFTAGGPAATDPRWLLATP